MDYRQPDAPESVKYHGGYDPADPPPADDGEGSPFTERCLKCEQWSSPNELDAKGLCPNCSPETQLKQTSTKEITGIVSVLKYFNERFGINE